MKRVFATARGGGRVMVSAAMLCGLLFIPQPARANTYLFTFTGQQALSALLASHQSTDGFFTGTTNFQESGYFGLWLRPDSAAVSSYTYATEQSPNPTSATPWETNTITDFSDLHSSATFVQFSKYPGVTQVSLLSAANGGPGGSNIFLNNTYFDDNTTVVGFGNTTATVVSILDPNARFAFTINTTQTLAGTILIDGLASEVRSGLTSTFTSAKTYTDIPFTLQLVAQTPEPGTFALLLAGGGILAAISIVRAIQKTRKKLL